MTPAGPVDRQQLITVAVIGGNDRDTRMVVEGVLQSIGVSFFIEGSAVYGVLVAGQDFARAQEALKAEQRLADRWISYAERPPE